jgi:ribosomal protein S18 acetylase RimI-like enzyme
MIFMELQFLDHIDFSVLHHAFLEAFSDYVVPLQPTEEGLRDMFTRRGADLTLSCGAFENGKLVGFTINGIDEFEALLTIYDTGSGVHPEFRRRGISDAIFRFLLPKLKETGAEQYLLEVFENNLPAVRLYQKIGFQTFRKFRAYRGFVSPKNSSDSRFEIRETIPDLDFWKRQWDWHPSWQNSIRSIERSKSPRINLGVFHGDVLSGYGIVYPANGDVPQFCIHQDQRRHGAGAALFAALQERAGLEKELRIINIEDTSESTIRFLESMGLQIFGTQLEMRMKL